MATAIAIHSTKRPSTADMQVTSIRLEPELKERLRDLSGDLGYQRLKLRLIALPFRPQFLPQPKKTNNAF
jgi:hypothetical protein